MALADPIVVVGLGQIGAVLAHGLLRAGHPVLPVTREIPASAVARDAPSPALVVVAVGERDLGPVLDAIPDAWRAKLALVQNELLPREWESRGLPQPTVAIVWFEKKKDTGIRVVRPTVLAGPGASVLHAALDALGVPSYEVEIGDALLFELVVKNLYILVANVAGLDAGGTTSALWRDHRALAETIASEVLDVQEALAGRALPRAELVRQMGDAFIADPEHACTGRSAPARLARAIAHSDAHGLAVPTLRAFGVRHLA